LPGGRLYLGVDAPASDAVVFYDAGRGVLGKSLEKKRFEARRPLSAVEPGPPGIALNAAANDVAVQVSDWIG